LILYRSAVQEYAHTGLLIASGGGCDMYYPFDERKWAASSWLAFLWGMDVDGDSGLK
jgi:hypothetical protein